MRQALLDVAASRRDLLDPLEDRDRLGGEAVLGVLVGEAHENGRRLPAAAREHERVRELEPQPLILRTRLDLSLEDFDGLGVLLLRDEVLRGLGHRSWSDFIALPSGRYYGPMTRRTEEMAGSV